ncbi:hypothetical protein ABPG77_007757 [Micractinium sp. CCAP 211/92]
MVSPPASDGDKATAAGTPPAVGNPASLASSGAAGGSEPSNNWEMPQPGDDGEQQQPDEREQASGKASGATAERPSAAPAKRRGNRGGSSYHQTFLPTTRAFLKELTLSNMSGKDILIPNWLYRVWSSEVGFPAGGDAGDGPAALRLTSAASGRSWEVGLGPHMGGMRLRASTMRDMLQVLGGRVGGGMLLTMDEHQPDLACFSMAVSVFPRWSCKDPPPVDLPGERVSVTTSRRLGDRPVAPPRVIPRPAPSLHKRKRTAAGERWDSGSEEGSSEEEGMFGGPAAVDGPSGLARSRRSGAGSRLAALLHEPSPELSNSEQSGSEEEEGGQEGGEEQELEESEEEWAQQQAWDACRAIVRSLLAHSEVKLYFGAPVKEEFAPGYYQQISRPMDLGTVLEKLARRAYESVYDLQDDVRLVFTNCRKFNSEGHHVRRLGDATAQRFERLWRQKRVEQLWEQQEGAGSGSECQEEEAEEELAASGIGASVTWGGNGWVAEAGYAGEDGEHTRVRVRGLATARQAEEAADLLALWCWQQRDPQARQACASRARLGGGGAAPDGLPSLQRAFRNYAISPGPGRMPRLWALAQLPRAHHVERYVRLAFGVGPPGRNEGSPVSGGPGGAPDVPAEDDSSLDLDEFGDDEDAVAALMAVAKQAAEASAALAAEASGSAGSAAAAEQQWRQQRQQQPASVSRAVKASPAPGGSWAQAPPAGARSAAAAAASTGGTSGRQPASQAAASAALAERREAAAQRWLQRAQAADFDHPLEPEEPPGPEALLPLKFVLLAGYGGEALQEVVEQWTAIPNQEEVHDLALLAVGQGESGCRGLEEDLRLMGLGCGSLARTAGGAAADASAGGAEQPATLPPSAAAALQRMQDRAVLAFAEAGQDSDSMLVALRKLATAKWGGQLLKDTVMRWPSLPAEQQQAAFDALLVAAAQGAWQQMEARLRLALEVSNA